jgi:hypothetical protein
MENASHHLQAELQNLSPRLAGLQGNAGGQQVPNGYFDELEAAVFQKIEDQGYAPAAASSQGDRPTRAGFRILRNPRVGIAAAATLFLAIAAAWFFRLQPTDPAIPENYRELAAALSPEDAAIYIAGNIHDFETAALENYAAAEPGAAETIAAPPAKRTQPAEELPAAQLELILQDLSEEELESIL